MIPHTNIQSLIQRNDFRSLLEPVLHLPKEHLRKRMTRAIIRQYEENFKDLLNKFKDGTSLPADTTGVLYGYI